MSGDIKVSVLMIESHRLTLFNRIGIGISLSGYDYQTTQDGDLFILKNRREKENRSPELERSDLVGYDPVPSTRDRERPYRLVSRDALNRI